MNKKTFRKVGFRLIHGCFLLCLVNLFAVTAVAQNHHYNETHYFPQFADGKFSDGTYYKSTLAITQHTPSALITCTLRLYGMSTALVSSGDTGGVLNSWRINIAIPADGAFIGDTPGTQSFVSGYAELTCSEKVFANVLFSFWSATGTKLSEATVFSSVKTGTGKRLIFDQTGNARLGVAFANLASHAIEFQISLLDTSGVVQATARLPVAAETATAKFIDEIMSVSIDRGFLKIAGWGDSTNPTVYSLSLANTALIGLRYTGTVFTTVPSTCATGGAPC